MGQRGRSGTGVERSPMASGTFADAVGDALERGGVGRGGEFRAVSRTARDSREGLQSYALGETRSARAASGRGSSPSRRASRSKSR